MWPDNVVSPEEKMWPGSQKFLRAIYTNGFCDLIGRSVEAGVASNTTIAGNQWTEVAHHSLSGGCIQ